MKSFQHTYTKLRTLFNDVRNYAGTTLRAMQEGNKPHHAESQYLTLLQDILDHGTDRDDRTGVGTVAVFGRTITHDMSHGFPLLTTRRISWKNVYYELRWFLSGSTRVDDLHPKVQHWWSPWADDNNELGPTYGKQLRRTTQRGTDQVVDLLQGLKENPFGRRHILTTWNPQDLPDMRLPPCHGLVTQFYRDGDYLDMTTYQRSSDTVIGLPNNLASYALLMHLVAWSLDPAGGIKPRLMTYMLGDTHLYRNHVAAAEEYLKRSQRPLPRIGRGYVWPATRLSYFASRNPVNRLFYVLDNNPEPDDVFTIEGYDPQPSIKLPVAV